MHLRRLTFLGLLLLPLATPVGIRAQQGVTLYGRLLDAETGAGIEGAAVELPDLGLRVVTDAEGRFQVQAVVPGGYGLRVTHIAYGVHTETVEVPAHDVAVQLTLSPRALELEPIDVEVLRPVATASTRSNVITRRQIEAVEGRARHVGDLVRTYIPGAAVSEARGGYLCVEFRAARSSRTTGCNFPLVVLDGLTVPQPAYFLRDLQLTDIERLEYVPASEATVRYGLGATHGALVIETRRSSLAQERRVSSTGAYPSYEWSAEPGHHRTWHAFGGAAMGAVSGTLLGLAAIGCAPGSEGSGAGCIEGAGAGAGLAALTLPILGSVVGARLFGRTDHSLGRVVPSLAMTTLPAALGYAVYVEGVKSGFEGERLLGGVLVIVATPLVSTLADHLFRSGR